MSTLERLIKADPKAHDQADEGREVVAEFERLRAGMTSFEEGHEHEAFAFLTPGAVQAWAAPEDGHAHMAQILVTAEETRRILDGEPFTIPLIEARNLSNPGALHDHELAIEGIDTSKSKFEGVFLPSE